MYINKLTKKGQLTIPAEYRKQLNSDFYVIEIEEYKIVLKPLKDLAGKLEKYGNKNKNKNLEEIIEEENQALEKAFREKHNS
ncbi:AbrB/MazE/SpoVT family DNA-binding domain-containing protein [Sulfurihydrogenibium azorense]|uniref:AbrB/MazE/SpoVT family DNA-binding domain-containing protein n=1 Tax=Sulfurihydrogenibium azorense TaxID=309806 RepID=UPI002409E2FA|nr:AbrB/MazE/SpoVT family DNA-binding domain-containing protein [Sulfurihydrogenibium azorense]MDM7274293.1 AbrB/MazE/SpoVT family DNA-binding domain-containing protein [Sulfurihydrogenibium azorense]